MSELSAKHCVACEEGSPPLAADAAQALLARLEGWTVTGGPRLAKQWKFRDFRAALAFVNRIGEIAEAEQHHPDLTLAWGRVGVELWTHAAGGLTENDFILAAKIDDARRTEP